LGAHKTADCGDCHKSESNLRFDVIGVNCIDCHRDDYQAAKQPDHIQAGFSENCISCHSINAFQWGGAGFNHSFFPLTEGHSQPSCAECHTGGNYTSLSKECYSCHQADYNNTTNPKHQTLGFPQTCELCHTLAPGWKPAAYKEHDIKSFPIYSGKHKGEWNSCTDCHTNSSNYAAFTCLNCHEHNKTSMDNEHSGERGYSYDSAACYRCHPRGVADD
jgi:nitrate/TMAO reductase-like tetraheme cytochrome c subunit